MIRAGFTAHLRQRLDFFHQVLIENYLIKDGPQADTLLTNDLNQALPARLSSSALLHLHFEELKSKFV